MSDPIVPAPVPSLAPAPAGVFFVSAPGPAVAPAAAPVVAAPVAVAPAAAPVVAAPVAPVPAAPATPAANPWARPKSLTDATVELDRVRAEATSAKAQAASANAALADHAAVQLAALPANLRDFVASTAGADPAAQLRAITGLHKAGLVGAPIAPGGGATTLPSTPSPVPATAAESDGDVIAARAYAEARAKSPMLASQIIAANPAAVARGQQKLAARTPAN